MYPYPFTYHRALSLVEAEGIYQSYESASYVSGGHTLIPAMKNRLAKPDVLIDLRAIPELGGIALHADRLEIGAASTHHAVSTSNEIARAIPSLALLAGSIADPQVRNVGTIGGSLANNDPSADYPAAVLGLGARIVTNKRAIGADAFFEGLFTTALEPGEIIVMIVFPIPEVAGYAKLCNLASRYAMAGSFVARVDGEARVAITGAGADGVFRWQEAEQALSRDFTSASLGGLAPDPATMASDLHGGSEYRAQIAATMTRRAVENLGSIHVR